jgi:CBS domain-containing protein
MKIIDIPEYKDKKNLLILDENTSLYDATRQMKERNYGAVIVTRAGKLCGIFTERDLLIKVAGAGKEIKGLLLTDVMSTDIKTAHPTDTVYESMRRMSQGRFRHLPVVESDGQISGLVSQGDFVAITWYQLFQQLKTHTKSSFITFSQLWLMIISFLAYLTVMLFFIGKK